MQILAIAAGGAVGAVMRFLVSNAVHQAVGRAFPFGTLTVNVVGSLLIGLLYVMFHERMDVSAYWRALLMIGVMGAFTTFSTFSLETLELLEKGALLKAGLNMVLNVGLCVLAAWIGVLIARTA